MYAATKYRLYVDESGSANYPSKYYAPADQRYLALTGVAISELEYNLTLCPLIKELKYIVTEDYDEKIVLHRDEIKDRDGVYAKLRDKTCEKLWNSQMQKIICDVDFTIFTVVIDKCVHRQRYRMPYHPYYYCLEVLLERYEKFLKARGCRGDVMFEARGKNEDRELKSQYSRVYEYGNRYVSSTEFKRFLTSKSLKVKSKNQQIEGLELADLLVLASKLDVLVSERKIENISSKYNQELIRLLQPKYYAKNGNLRGNGKKLLA